MATDRFYFWRGYYDALRALPSASERGEFVMAMCSWAFDGSAPDFSENSTMEFAWLLVRDQIAESVDIGRKQSERGKRGGRPKADEKSGAKSGAKTTAKSGAESVMDGHERTGHEPGPFQGPDAGFASAPNGAGSPASDDDFRESFMLSQSLVGKPVDGGA